MGTVTLTTLRARARERADMPVAGFVADSATGIDMYINEGIAKLHERLVQAYGAAYYEKTAAFTTDGTEFVTLPADLYKLEGVDLNYNGAKLTLMPFMQRERNAYANAILQWSRAPSYRLTAGKLQLLPVPPSGLTGTIWYSPVAPVLDSNNPTTSSFTSPASWERYVPIYAAIQMKAKQEDDTSALQRELEILEQELRLMAESRNSDAPMHAVDLDLAAADERIWWWA